MRKALRGYAKDKNGNLILIGTMPVPFSKEIGLLAVLRPGRRGGEDRPGGLPAGFNCFPETVGHM
jgi:hypothetical protein